MSEPAPRVSIGLPVYNGAKYLQKTLESILSQTFEDFELIISDNASDDGTKEICESYASSDKRIRYYRNEKNLGAAWNYRRVFHLSKGEYFKWAAADDLLGADFFKYCVEVLDNEPQVVLCYPKTIIIDENGEVVKKYDDNLNLQASNGAIRFLTYLYSVDLCNAIFGLIRSCSLIKTRLLGNFAAHDNILFAELSLLGKFREIPHYMFFRRLHSESSAGVKIIGNKFKNTKGMDKISEFINPEIKRRIIFTNWRKFREYLIAIRRSPLKFHEKSFLLTYMSMYFIKNFPAYWKELKVASSQIISTYSKKNMVSNKSLLIVAKKGK